jgi:peptidoglycan-N-acetylglucosamine deacetylase
MIWKMKDRDKTLYLTFDDGPEPMVTPWVLDQLKAHNAKAAFFVVGKNACDHPEIVQRITAEGHSIGNHTYNHLNGWKTKTPVYLENVEACEKIVPSKLFRPPYGRIKRSQSSAISKQNKIIMWDVLSRDYEANLPAEKCLQGVIQRVRPGSIVVFHDSKKAEKNLREVLPKVLQYFSENGWNFKALPEDLAHY